MKKNFVRQKGKAVFFPGTHNKRRKFGRWKVAFLFHATGHDHHDEDVYDEGIR